MPPEKVTKMVLDVDLNCSDCYKKVKKVLCKIPQIRDQEYDVDKNKVKITVICCSPEKIRDKLCYKGGNSIQAIQILRDPEKPKPKDGDKPKPTNKPKDGEKPEPVEKPKPVEKLKGEEKEKAPKGDAHKKSDPNPKAEAAKMMFEPPVHGYPQMYQPNYNYPVPMVGYGQYYEHGYGMPLPPAQCGYGMPLPLLPPPQNYGYEHAYYGASRSSADYFTEDNSQGCSVM